MKTKSLMFPLLIMAFSAMVCAATDKTDSVKTLHGIQQPRQSDTLAAQARQDTMIKTPATDSLLGNKVAGDSLKGLGGGLGGDTSKVKIPAIGPAAPPPEDTLYHFWNRSYWSIGAGWGLGSFPLFLEWQKGLPDSASNLVEKNSQVPKFTVAQQADAYYIVWPLLLGFTPFPGERNSLSVESSWYFLFSGKSFIATLKNDSLPAQSVSWNQSCAAYFFTVGLSYRHAIAEEYFKVEGVQRTALVLGLSVTPLLRVTKSASFSSSTGLADTTLAQLRSHIDNKAWNGAGVSWKLGISTLKKLSQRSALEMDLVYIGRFNGLFSRGLQWKDINSSSDTPNAKVSFMSSTFEINISLLTGKKKIPQ